MNTRILFSSITWIFPQPNKADKMRPYLNLRPTFTLKVDKNTRDRQPNGEIRNNKNIAYDAWHDIVYGEQEPGNDANRDLAAGVCRSPVMSL